MLTYLVIFVCALCISLFITPLMRWIAIRLNIIDAPTTRVKTHKTAVPYMGGLAMLTAMLITIIAGAYYLDLLTKELAVIIGGMIFLALLGFIDDVRSLKPITRFMMELGLAGVMAGVGIRLHVIYLPEWLNITLTILWIVGITNALNIIDIMDGLASGISIIAGATFFFVAVSGEQTLVLLIMAAMVGAVAGFWYHNFFPAKIYMGDSGAYLLGFSLASVAIIESYTAVNPIALLSPILILGIPIYDTFLVMILRLIRGKNPFYGSKDHFALRLEALGIPRKYVVIFIYHVAVILGMASYIATRVDLWGALFTYCLIALIALTAGRQLSLIDMER